MAALEDKELAQEWVKNNTDESPNSFRGEELQEAFLAGIEAATFELNKGIIQVLTKENAELKERCSILDKSLITSTKNNIERQKIIDEIKEQLTKAKELLKRLLEEERDNVFWEMNGADKSSYFQVVKQAEQFLKESAEWT